jgi:hypothetical protein
MSDKWADVVALVRAVFWIATIAGCAKVLAGLN